jgi:hypothetical protein
MSNGRENRFQYSDVPGRLNRHISKTDNGQCGRVEKPRDDRLIREATGLVNHVYRWISSDVNSGGIRFSRIAPGPNEMLGLNHMLKSDSQLLFPGKKGLFRGELRSI